jgi:hypothetical protein
VPVISTSSSLQSFDRMKCRESVLLTAPSEARVGRASTLVGCALGARIIASGDVGFEAGVQAAAQVRRPVKQNRRKLIIGASQEEVHATNKQPRGIKGNTAAAFRPVKEAVLIFRKPGRPRILLRSAREQWKVTRTTRINGMRGHLREQRLFGNRPYTRPLSLISFSFSSARGHVSVIISSYSGVTSISTSTLVDLSRSDSV